MIKINNVNIGFPTKVGNNIDVSVITFKTDVLTVNTYWELFNISTLKVINSEGIEVDDIVSECLANGNYELTEIEYNSWGPDNSIVENAVLKNLSLTRI
mgnify:CR=1 FL=1